MSWIFDADKAVAVETSHKNIFEACLSCAESYSLTQGTNEFNWSSKLVQTQTPAVELLKAFFPFYLVKRDRTGLNSSPNWLNLTFPTPFSLKGEPGRTWIAVPR